MRSVLVVLLVIVGLLYTCLCGALFVFQRSLIYFPTGSRGGGETMSLQVGAQTVQVSVRPTAGPAAVVYFGGNAEDVSLSVPEIVQAFPNRALYLMHYPGYGGSSGKPSEKAIVADALALFDRVQAEHPDVVVVGRSLGSGVAVQVASQRPVTRLVLVTPFDSLQNVAAYHYPYFPARWLMRDTYQSWKYAPKVAVPTTIVVAAEDEVVPRASSERLLGCFKPGLVRYVVVPDVGHNTISDSTEYVLLLRGE